jgi:hypothetical protein
MGCVSDRDPMGQLGIGMWIWLGIWITIKADKSTTKKKKVQEKISRLERLHFLELETFSVASVLPRGLRINRPSTFFGVSAITSVTRECLQGWVQCTSSAPQYGFCFIHRITCEGSVTSKITVPYWISIKYDSGHIKVRLPLFYFESRHYNWKIILTVWLDKSHGRNQSISPMRH